MDPFTVTVGELAGWLSDKPREAPIVITPPSGESFPLLGWAFSVDRTVVLTGADGAYDTNPEVSNTCQ